MYLKRKRTFIPGVFGSASKRIGLALSLLFLTSDPAFAGSRLLYFEAEGVGGYSSEKDGVIYYSVDKADVMQKPSIGFDYVERLSGETGDFLEIFGQCYSPPPSGY